MGSTLCLPSRHNVLPQSSKRGKQRILLEHEIIPLFVEPSENFLDTLILGRCHHIVRGGRGSGKTMILRRLSYPIAPPRLPEYPYLGCYIPLDFASLAPLDAEKVGTHNSWMFESYFSGVLIQALVSGLQRCAKDFSVSQQALCDAIQARIFPEHTRCSELSSLAVLFQQCNDQLWNAANQFLAACEQADAKVVLTFHHVHIATRAVQELLSTGDWGFFVLFLLDRYDEAHGIPPANC